MLFHTWTFFVFMVLVLPVLFALRRTRFWIPWLLVASYVFYGWWNPYYLILVFYSTALDFVLVALMDHCPPDGKKFAWKTDAILKAAFLITSGATLVCFVLAVAGPKTLR